METYAVTVEEVHRKRDEYNRWIYSSDIILNNAQCSNISQRQIYSLSLFQLCQEHAKSIGVLLEINNVASALALLRASFEALLRGWWVANCISDEKFSEDINSGRFSEPAKNKILQDILKSQPSQGIELLMSHAEKVKTAYNDFTHGGFNQVARRFSDGVNIGYTIRNHELLNCYIYAKAYDGLSKLKTSEILKNEEIHQRILNLLQSE